MQNERGQANTGLLSTLGVPQGQTGDFFSVTRLNKVSMNKLLDVVRVAKGQVPGQVVDEGVQGN